MKLFGAGPIKMDSETLRVSGLQLPYFRTQEFSCILLECDRILKEFLQTTQNSKTMYLTASGTAAMEAAIVNIFTEKDKILIINGGTFGKRFEQLCLEIHNIPHVSLVLPFGKQLTVELLEEYRNQEFTGMLVNLHETSTGQLYDINIISKFCRDQNLCLVVDAISSFLIDEFEMDKFGIDATIVSSQKGLGLAPGLSMLVVNERTYENRIKKSIPKCLYLRFEDYSRDIVRGQTPYTPAVGIILQLHEKLLRLQKLGLEKIVSHNKEIAEYFREKVRKIGYRFPEYSLSNGLTPILCEKENAKELVQNLIDKYGVYVVPNGGELGNKIFRVGHMGTSMNREDIDFLIECLKGENI